MKPILFEETATSFTSNGIGRLSDALTCKVTEERNGQYELEMEYPITGEHYSDIGIRKIIVAKPSAGGRLQPFRIYKVTKPISGRVGVYAQHISYDLSKNVVMPFSVSASSNACTQALAGLKSHAIESCPFNFTTDVTRIAGYSQTTPMSFRSRLGGSEGSVLDQFHGEYEFDVYDVKLHTKRGSDNGVSLRYGKNIIDLNQEENISETITGVVPFWSDLDNTTVVTLPERVVYSQYASRYSQKLTVPLDLSGEYEDKPSVATIRAAAQSYIAQTNLGVPTVSITVSFVNLRDTAEYADIANLETVNLCDDVHVQFEPLGIDTTAEVVKCVWDVLSERYNEVTVGSLKSSLTATLNDQNTKTMASIDKVRAQAGNAANEATNWLLSGDGYIVARKDENGEWKELLAMDSPDEATAQNVMILNQNGLGGSSTGVNGPFTSAILSNGTIVASQVKTGILSDGYVDPQTQLPAPRFSLNMETGALVMKNGTFTGTITGSSISGSTIRFGDATGQNYADMKWDRIPNLPVEAYALMIQANGGRPIEISSTYGVNTSKLQCGAGTASLSGHNSVFLTTNGQISLTAYKTASEATGNIEMAAAGDVKVNGWYATKATAGNLVIGTFQDSNGYTYLGVYSDNGDGTAAPVGNVRIA